MTEQTKKKKTVNNSENVVHLPLWEKSVFGVRVGRLCGLSADREPLVMYEGQVGGPVPARSIVPLDEQIVIGASESGREVLLVLTDDRVSHPVIMGWLQDPVVAPRTLERRKPKNVHLKGDRVVLEAERELELKTKHGRITLRRNGVVQVEGMKVETRSRGLHRIKGAKIEIN